MKNRYFAVLFLLIAAFLPVFGCGFPIFYKPSFGGRVIDADTKQPIEGAIAVAIYRKAHLGIEPVSSIVDIREALTDKEGIFYIPSKVTLLSPPNWQETTFFIIFKRGYSYFPDYKKTLPSLNLEYQELFFGGQMAKVQHISTCEVYAGEICYKQPYTGIIALKQLTSRNERIDAQTFIFPSNYADFFRNKPSLLLSALSEERRYLFGH